MESTSQQLQRGTSSATVAAAASGGKAVYDKSLAAGVFPDDSCQEGLEEELEEELRTKPLLDSVRSELRPTYADQLCCAHVLLPFTI